jgi:hypothetical protein
MKIVKSTRNHKLNKEFPFIAEFGWGKVDETIEFGQLCMAFERRFGPSATNDWQEPTQFNPRWRKEIKTKTKRRRIYFKEMKDWQWAQLSR